MGEVSWFRLAKRLRLKKGGKKVPREVAWVKRLQTFRIPKAGKGNHNNQTKTKTHHFSQKIKCPTFLQYEKFVFWFDGPLALVGLLTRHLDFEPSWVQVLRHDQSLDNVPILRGKNQIVPWIEQARHEKVQPGHVVLFTDRDTVAPHDCPRLPQNLILRQRRHFAVIALALVLVMETWSSN